MCFSHRMPRKNNSPPENCLPKQTFKVTSESSTWKPTNVTPFVNSFITDNEMNSHILNQGKCNE